MGVCEGVITVKKVIFRSRFFSSFWQDTVLKSEFGVIARLMLLLFLLRYNRRTFRESEALRVVIRCLYVL